MSEEAKDAELLEDLLTGKDRLLTTGEVAEILNVNVNTLYLWRASGEVKLPFHRFIAPGQSRGMIRYRYNDIVEFLQAARRAGEEDIAAAGKELPLAGQTAVKIIITDEEELAATAERRRLTEQNRERSRQKKSKAKRDNMLKKPLESLLSERFTPKFTPAAEAEVAPDEEITWDDEQPHATPSALQDQARAFLKDLLGDNSPERSDADNG